MSPSTLDTPPAPTTRTLHIETTVAGMRSACRAARRASGPDATLGLVPTMGALHAGHLSLVHAAQAACDVVAVSLFVNPTQFAPGEDLAQYPRTFDHDCTLLQQAGVDLLFAPTPQDMYPNMGPDGPGHTWVDVPALGARLDGRSRPTHFRGVATVVAKLFNIVGPDLAFFGQKDAAQVAVLRAMTRDLNLPVDLRVCPTIREPDGLALSSRNRYLSPTERKQALALPRALDDIHRRAEQGTHDPATLQRKLHDRLASASGLRLDYAEIVDPDTLLPVPDLTRGALVAVAAWVGTTRLIDNVILPPFGTRP